MKNMWVNIIDFYFKSILKIIEKIVKHEIYNMCKMKVHENYYKIFGGEM